MTESKSLVQILSDHKSRSLSPLSQLSIFLVILRVFLLMSLTVHLLQECITNFLYWDMGKTTFCVCMHSHTHTHTCTLICEQLFVTAWTESGCPWNFPGNNTGVDCHFLLQVIFPTQGLKPNLLHWQPASLPAEPPGSPKTLEQPDPLISLFLYPLLQIAFWSGDFLVTESSEAKIR